jgi:AcrR family transcriptional regulator
MIGRLSLNNRLVVIDLERINMARADGAVAARSHKRRREILDAAALVFYEKGYDASSTQDIADAVGILKGSLYYYVESKEQFLFEIIKEAHDLGLEILHKVAEAEGDVIDRLIQLVRLHVEYFAANRIKVSVFFREFRALAPQRRRDINELGHMYRDCVESLVKEGQADGTISASIDVSLAGIAIVEMLNSIARWYRDDGRATADRIADQAATILIGGLATSRAMHQRGGEEQFREQLVRRRTTIVSTRRRSKA